MNLSDDFSTDPYGGTPRWVNQNGSAVWDSTNFELDVVTNGGTPPQIRYNTSPGNLEQECQSTFALPASGERGVGPAVRINSSAVDYYGITVEDVGGLFVNIHRFNAGSRSTVFQNSFGTYTAGNFVTIRIAATGAVGENVAFFVWLQDHGSSKPSDPGWLGSDASPDWSPGSDSSVDRHDDSDDNFCGIGGRQGISTDYDTRHDYWRARNISDRGGGPVALPFVTIIGAKRI
jgi:hypothetical protein